MNSFVMTDLASCIGCRACEVACVMSHNNGCLPETTEGFLPRIRVIQTEQAQTALTCRHCESAPCVDVCPTHALVCQNNSVQVLQEKCIGCKNCIIACPFGAITLTSTSEKKTTQRASAYKCDLCQDNPTGQACVNACPTKAIQLFNPLQIASTQRQKQLCTATGKREKTIQKSTAVINALKETPRQDPTKKEMAIRKDTFSEIYNNFSQCQTSEQGNRCVTCGNHSFCEWTCPLHNRIPQWIKLGREGKILEAVELSHQYSSLPEVCGRVCPQDKLCEGSCTLKRHNLGSVTIGNIERFITDTAFDMGWKPDLSYVKPTGKKVAIIGAGPAGIGCADVLNRNGIKAVVFDRHPEIGGMLTFGIPSFKLDKSIMTHRRHLFTEQGIEFHLNTEVGHDLSFDHLMKDYDAIFIAVGTYTSMRANLDNEEAEGIYDALPFLTANTKHIMGLPQRPEEPYINVKDKQVVVLGGGDTAMDCVRTSIRHHASKVICAYRRDEENMPGSKKEVKNAREEGVEFLFNVQPQKIELAANGKACGIKMMRTEMGAPDASGRRHPIQIPDSEFLLEADIIIKAFGFSSHPMPWLAKYGVKLNSRGTIIAPRGNGQYCQTTNSKIFAGGDVVRGADLVVTALADGRRAAEGIIKYLKEPIQTAPHLTNENTA